MKWIPNGIENFVRTCLQKVRPQPAPLVPPMQPGEPIYSCATTKGQFQDDERRLPLLPRQNNREKATYANATDEEIRAYIEKKTGQPAPEDMYGLYLLLYGQNEL